MQTPTAAVLLAIITASTEPYILLLERAPHLSKHAGQISLPGGKIEISDDSATDAAIREFQEETGITALITIKGLLSQQLTSSNHIVQPVWGTIDSPVTITPQVSEVSSIIQLPLDVALALENYGESNITGPRSLKHRYYLQYQEHFIWGVTATILREFAALNVWK
jgi:8-oxo-dGTP pyrophosphatase MutT (NUDIX family)